MDLICSDLNLSIISPKKDFSHIQILFENSKIDYYPEKNTCYNKAAYFLACLYLANMVAKKYHKAKKYGKIPSNLRNIIKDLNHHKCLICGNSKDLITVHHIRSSASGGKSTRSNLASICFKHHTRLHEIAMTLENKSPIKQVDNPRDIYQAIWIIDKILNYFFVKKKIRKIYKHNIPKKIPPP